MVAAGAAALSVVLLGGACASDTAGGDPMAFCRQLTSTLEDAVTEPEPAARAATSALAALRGVAPEDIAAEVRLVAEHGDALAAAAALDEPGERVAALGRVAGDEQRAAVERARQRIERYATRTCALDIGAPPTSTSPSRSAADALTDVQRRRPDGAGGAGTTPPRDVPPELAELVGACHDGDLAACDQAWLASPSGSAVERWAASCGGRAAGRADTPGTCG